MNNRQLIKELVNKKSWITSDFQRLKKMLPAINNLYIAAKRAAESGDASVLNSVLAQFEPIAESEDIETQSNHS
jgi:hypothetical protein